MTKRKLDAVTAVSIAEAWEGEGRHTYDEVRDAWQYLIDTGLAWTLQGWFGRQAKALIESGVCREGNRKVA